MSHQRDNYQLYQCPQEFQDRIDEVGGFNRYGNSNFLIVWGQGGEDACFYRSGGAWHVDGEPSFTGYRDLLIAGGSPSWCLLQWEDAVVYGTPESYYISNYDEETGMQDLGEYPYQGKYKLLYTLSWRDMSQGQMKIEAMPLNSFLIDTVIPIIMSAKDITWEKTKAAMQAQKEKDDKADLDMIEDVMRDSSLAFKGPVSYARQGCRTSIIDRKVEQMQQQWNKMATNAKMLGRGLSSHTADPTIR
jgi:hypothetical protein